MTDRLTDDSRAGSGGALTPSPPATVPSTRSPSCRPATAGERLARRLLFRALSHLEHGQILLTEGETVHVFGRASEILPLRATVRVHDPACYPTMLLGGNVGAGRAYIEGLWSADDLVTLVRIVAANQETLARVDGGLSWLTKPLDLIYHAVRRNSRRGARRNIAAHYDLGNDFFAQFLDETMMYSSAWFERDDDDLARASRAKLRRLCDKLALTPADHVLEIGTGWGGFAEHAARHHGCRVTTTTISEAQYRHARARIQASGLADRVTVLNRDYRELTGTYDKLVSIEMIEAVGAEHFDNYFEACSRLLAPHGLMALQAIVIPDQRYDQARRAVDFIKRFVFPGGCLPSVGAIATSIGRSSDLSIVQLEDLTPDYALTLRHWRERFLAARARVRELGFDDAFIRLWEYYLAYCEGGFRERVIGDVQILLARSRWRGRVPLPRGG
ncbi:MAG: cyclopropane-fatty-acyl-phospholipid synthase family protein [Candidatus Eiseniibacteriota bacterium]|jgi:cyclopropane-fatty-acyl-phospholipid synthase